MVSAGERIREIFRRHLFPTLAGRVGALPSVGGKQPLQVGRSQCPDILDEGIRPDIDIRPPDTFRRAESGENILRHPIVIPSSPVDNTDDNLAIHHPIRALLIHCEDEIRAKRGLGEESACHSGRNILHVSVSERIPAQLINATSYRMKPPQCGRIIRPCERMQGRQEDTAREFLLLLLVTARFCRRDQGETLSGTYPLKLTPTEYRRTTCIP